MTEAVAIVLGVALIAAIVLALYLAYLLNQRTTGYVAAQDIAHTAGDNLLEAERQRDDEHAARVSAEAVVADLKSQLAATQAALNSISKENLSAIHDAVARGDADGAIAVIRGVFSQLPGAGAAAQPAAGGGAAAAPAVQPAGGVHPAEVANARAGS